MDEKPMSRHKAREHAFCLIFTHDFNTDLTASDTIESYQEAEGVTLDSFACDTFCGTVDYIIQIDDTISRYAKSWKLARISKVSLAVLRLAFYELLYSELKEKNIIINEAIELAKKYEDEKAASFVNGVLGAYAKDCANE
ncbi:MAG: transcription antitermination factor NusB [Ruminococcaceae bacterium]|nr:transcription antitermination factor NusB [Oscillospiraceae bacterium]